jgi:hypothetical protein
MANKPEYVDLISDATRQSRRRVVDLILETEVKETSRLAHRSERLEAWREETFTPWRIKPWNIKSWG